jgi:hypothetical protein
MADTIDEMKKEWALRYSGADLTPERASQEFALMNFETRVAHLRNIETPAAMGVRETADRLAMERALRRTHETLRRVGR